MPAVVALWLAATLCAPLLPAATVYRSVDANGVVSFSDTQPADAAEVETLVIEVQQPQLTETEQERLEAMRETTDRMAADRQAREQQRAELRQQAARQQAAQPPDDLCDRLGRVPAVYPIPCAGPAGTGRARITRSRARPCGPASRYPIAAAMITRPR